MPFPRSLLVVPCLVACTEPASTPDGTEDPSGEPACVLVGSTHIEASDTTLGWSLDEVSVWLDGAWDAEIHWSGESEFHPLDLRIDLDLTTAMRDDNEANAAAEASGIHCDDFVRVPATLVLNTDDGRLAESWPVEVRVAAVWYASVQVQPENTAGTLAIEDLLQDYQYEQAELFLSLELANDPRVVQGGLYANLSGMPTDDGPHSSDTDQIQLARFQAAEE